MRFDKEENKKSCATCHIARCQGTVKSDTKCHALKIMKSPYSNCSKIGMMKSNSMNKRPRGVLHPSIKKGRTTTFEIQTIGDKIVETLFLNRVISENKRICTPRLSPPFKVGVFVVFYRLLEQGHNIARRGWGRKAIFPPFQVNKTYKCPVLGEVFQLILSPIAVS